MPVLSKLNIKVNILNITEHMLMMIKMPKVSDSMNLNDRAEACAL